MSKKILIVDDDKALCEFFRATFELANFEVFILHDGMATIEFLAQNTVDVITLDHDMPEMTGLETLNILKERNIADKAKIIILSANTSIEDNETYKQLADYVLIKPVGYQQLTDLAQKLTVQIQ